MSAAQSFAANPFDNALRAAVRALNEVVAPSVDAANPLAREQLAIVCKFLETMRQRAGSIGDLHRADLELALGLAVAVADHVSACPAEVREGLAAARQEGGDLVRSPGASGDELQRAAARLDALLSGVVRCARALEPAARQAIERAVLAGSDRRVELRRAWHAPMGLDPDMKSVLPLADVLRGEAHRSVAGRP